MIERRDFMRVMCAVFATAVAGCKKHHGASLRCPGPRSDFTKVDWIRSDLDVFRIGPESGRPVVLLHEIPGLNDEDLALARCLSKEGFKVYVPKLFGKLGQDSGALGLAASCFGTSPLFACEALKARSRVLDKLEPICDQIAAHDQGDIGAVGMCLTGVLPLALLPNHAIAAVLCQPTLPFDFGARKPVDEQLTDMGLGDDDLRDALDSPVPFLLMHYKQDELSPTLRIETLGHTFGQRVAIIELDGEGKHSSLASDLDERAFTDAVTYLKVRLGAATGPAPMQVATLAGQPCQIASDGTWKAL